MVRALKYRTIALTGARPVMTNMETERRPGVQCRARVPSIILDGNSQVWLHKPMETEAFTKINRARIRAQLEG